MARLIQESINRSKSVSSLNPESLSLFCLIIPQLNSFGKMDGDLYTIKGTVCRYVDWLTLEKIELCLKEITEKTDMKWWEDENGDYWIHALNFEKHQPGLRLDRRGEDKLPSYEEVESEGYLGSHNGVDLYEVDGPKSTVFEGIDPLPNHLSSESNKDQCKTNSDTSPGLTPEHSRPEEEGEEEGEEEYYTPPNPPAGGKGENLVFLKNSVDGEQTVEAEKVTGRAKTRKRGELTKKQEADFERFWEAYPKKISKGQARRTWQKLNPTEQLQGQILASLERAKTSDQWAKESGRFIPHPSTWLNAEGWEDEHISCENSVQDWLKSYETESEVSYGTA